MEDKILAQLEELRRSTETLTARMAAMERRWSWVSSAALLIIGVVGGPNAVDLIAAGAA